MQKFLPYTYIIGWPEQKLWYYGVRLTPKADPEQDLWTEYFTSSKQVAYARVHFGEPSIVHVDKRDFKCQRSARRHESHMLRQIYEDDDSNYIWLNRTNLLESVAIPPRQRRNQYSKRGIEYQLLDAQSDAERFAVCMELVKRA